MEAQLACDLMNEDLKREQENTVLEVLMFDMEKTLPLSRIPTNIIIYKRQLWLYNCGIHSSSNGGDIAMFGLRMKLEEVHKKLANA
ncbi:hypothetical protein PR048_022786 [Dryococelus australis]|uniref:Uncharacterized protein n=1 Tax=Dryococelus australis TaxID=614101 RepID=A0ABQ9GSB4_9NEOP|nr:hypothetical protein PR048_022786 [Dryococelus australis]